MDWSCDADLSTKLVEAVAMEMNIIPRHAQTTIGSVSGLQIVLLQEADKLYVRRLIVCCVLNVLRAFIM